MKLNVEASRFDLRWLMGKEEVVYYGLLSLSLSVMEFHFCPESLDPYHQSPDRSVASGRINNRISFLAVYSGFSLLFAVSDTAFLAYRCNVLSLTRMVLWIWSVTETTTRNGMHICGQQGPVYRNT